MLAIFGYVMAVMRSVLNDTSHTIEHQNYKLRMEFTKKKPVDNVHMHFITMDTVRINSKGTSAENT